MLVTNHLALLLWHSLKTHLTNYDILSYLEDFVRDINAMKNERVKTCDKEFSPDFYFRYYTTFFNKNKVKKQKSTRRYQFV